MTEKQIIGIADKAYGEDALVASCALDAGADLGDTLALFIVRELRDVYDRRAGTLAQLEEARRAMCLARRQLQAVERAFEIRLEAIDPVWWKNKSV